MCIPLIGFVVSWSFPLYLNLFKAKELDGYLKSQVGIVAGADASVEDGGGGRGEGAEKMAGVTFGQSFHKED